MAPATDAVAAAAAPDAFARPASTPEAVARRAAVPADAATLAQLLAPADQPGHERHDCADDGDDDHEPEEVVEDGVEDPSDRGRPAGVRDRRDDGVLDAANRPPGDEQGHDRSGPQQDHRTAPPPGEEDRADEQQDRHDNRHDDQQVEHTHRGPGRLEPVGPDERDRPEVLPAG